MVSGKRPKYQWKRILDLSFLFTIKNFPFGFALCNPENGFFLFYVWFKIVIRKSVVSPINCNIEKHYSEYGQVESMAKSEISEFFYRGF